MAVSNAFGSNSFNIMVALGLPWLLYTSFGTGFEPYHGLPDEGITESVTILAAVLLLFIMIIIPSGFTLYRWHAVLFVIIYIAFLAYEIGKVYW
jgi:Ca2+/Na+ antiporter